MTGERPPLVTVHRTPAGAIRLAVAGEVDSSTAGELADAIVRAIHREPTDEIVVDLASVTFLGCAGATAILAGQALAGHRGVCFSTINVPAGAHRLLTLITSVVTTVGEEVHPNR